IVAFVVNARHGVVTSVVLSPKAPAAGVAEIVLAGSFVSTKTRFTKYALFGFTSLSHTPVNARFAMVLLVHFVVSVGRTIPRRVPWHEPLSMTPSVVTVLAFSVLMHAPPPAPRKRIFEITGLACDTKLSPTFAHTVPPLQKPPEQVPPGQSPFTAQAQLPAPVQGNPYDAPLLVWQRRPTSVMRI